MISRSSRFHNGNTYLWKQPYVTVEVCLYPISLWNSNPISKMTTFKPDIQALGTKERRISRNVCLSLGMFICICIEVYMVSYMYICIVRF